MTPNNDANQEEPDIEETQDFVNSEEDSTTEEELIDYFYANEEEADTEPLEEEESEVLDAEGEFIRDRLRPEKSKYDRPDLLFKPTTPLRKDLRNGHLIEVCVTLPTAEKRNPDGTVTTNHIGHAVTLKKEQLKTHQFEMFTNAKHVPFVISTDGQINDEALTFLRTAESAAKKRSAHFNIRMVIANLFYIAIQKTALATELYQVSAAHVPQPKTVITRPAVGGGTVTHLDIRFIADRYNGGFAVPSNQMEQPAPQRPQAMITELAHDSQPSNHFQPQHTNDGVVKTVVHYDERPIDQDTDLCNTESAHHYPAAPAELMPNQTVCSQPAANHMTTNQDVAPATTVMHETRYTETAANSQFVQEPPNQGGYNFQNLISLAESKASENVRDSNTPLAKPFTRPTNARRSSKKVALTHADCSEFPVESSCSAVSYGIGDSSSSEVRRVLEGGESTTTEF